ncbi:MAG: hypothetical protein ACRBK7_30330 [Acidimicrobiales bacterium]
MSRRGGRAIGLPALALIIALVVANIALLALNLRKHDRLPFRSSADSDAGEFASAGAGDEADEGDADVDVGESESDSGGEAVAGPSVDGEGDAVFAAEPGENAPGLAGTTEFDAVLLHDAGQVALPAVGVAALDEIAALLIQYPTAGVSVVAHIDDLGDSDANAAVAFARALAVVDYLELVGIDRRRTVTAIPPASPDAPPNDSEEERRFNRRVEVKLLSAPGGGGGRGGEVAGEGDALVVDQRWSIDGALAAGFDCPEPVAGQPFRVGYAADLGSLGVVSDGPGSEAARHLARMINCSGGVEGRPLEVLVVDVSGTTLASRPAIAELLDWQPDAIIGPAVAATGLRLREAVGGRLPLVFPMVAEPALADPNRGSFTMLPMVPGSAAAAARFAIDQAWLRVATIRPSGNSYHTDTAAFVEAFTAAGGLVAAEVEVDAAGGIGAAVQDVVAQSGADTSFGGGFDIVFAPIGPEPFAELQEEAVAADLNVALINSDPTVVYDVGAEFDARSYALTPVLADQAGRIARLDRSFAAATGSPSSNTAAAALVGDALAVIINAYLNAGQGDAEAVSGAISGGLPVQGVGGILFFGGAGSPIRTNYVVQQFDGGVGPVATIEP